MSAVELLGEVARAWAGWIVEAAITSSVLLALLLGSWPLLRRLVSAHVASYVFLVPLLPLVLPPGEWLVVRWPADAVPASVQEVLRAVAAGPLPPASAPSIGDAAADAIVETAPAMVAGAAGDPVGDRGPALAAATASPRLEVLLLLVWCLAVTVLAARWATAQRRLRRLVRRATVLEQGPLVEQLRLLRRVAGVRVGVRLAVSREVSSPATWGIRRPVVLLPPDLATGLARQQLRWLLLHELAHLKRRDLLVAAAVRLVRIAWFFHPVVWIAARRLECQREFACDDAALARCRGGDRRPYAAALFAVIESVWSAPLSPRPGMLTASGNHAFLRSRMMRLLDVHRPVSRGLTTLSIAGILAGAALALPLSRLPRLTPAPAAQDGAAVEFVLEEVEESGAVGQEALAVVDDALRWLVEHQEADGHWRIGPEAEATWSGEFNEVGVTALATLALLGSEDGRVGTAEKDAAGRALAWLRSVQEADGRFGPQKDWAFMPSHAVATRAWIRAHRGSTDETWKEPARQAVAFIVKAQNPYRGWRFGIRDGDNDSFVTSLMLLALAEAKAAGLEVPEQSVAWGMKWLDDMDDAQTGRCGYNAPGSLTSRLADKAADFPPDRAEVVTSVALLARLAHGRDPDGEVLGKAVVLLRNQPPIWDEDAGTIDYYYWSFGMAALARTGGADAKAWQAFLEEALLEGRRRDEQGRVWWPAVDAWSAEGATTYATAMNALALQAALR